MKTRRLDFVLGQILLGFVLFAFNIDGAVVSSVFMSNAESIARRNAAERQDVDSNDVILADRLLNAAALCDLENGEETLGSNSTRRRLNRGRLTLRVGRSGQSSSTRTVTTSLDRLAIEPSLEFAFAFYARSSSRSWTRPLFLILLKLRN